MEVENGREKLSGTPLPKLTFRTQEKTGQKIDPDEEFPAGKVPGTALESHSGWNRVVLI